MSEPLLALPPHQKSLVEALLERPTLSMAFLDNLHAQMDKNLKYAADKVAIKLIDIEDELHRYL